MNRAQANKIIAAHGFTSAAELELAYKMHGATVTRERLGLSTFHFYQLLDALRIPRLKPRHKQQQRVPTPATVWTLPWSYQDVEAARSLVADRYSDAAPSAMYINNFVAARGLDAITAACKLPRPTDTRMALKCGFIMGITLRVLVGEPITAVERRRSPTGYVKRIPEHLTKKRTLPPVSIARVAAVAAALSAVWVIVEVV